MEFIVKEQCLATRFYRVEAKNKQEAEDLCRLGDGNEIKDRAYDEHFEIVDIVSAKKEKEEEQKLINMINKRRIENNIPPIKEEVENYDW